MATQAFALAAEEETLENLTQESIAVRAYELWQERGCPEGQSEIDWFQAEEELLNRD